MREIQVIITEFPSMPNRFYYTLIIDKQQKSKGRDAGTSGAEAAAAKAVELANSYYGQYTIFAPKKVLDCIPERLRSGVSK